MTTDEQLELPRGVRVFTESGRALPHALQWRVEGKRRTRFFPSIAKRDKFARGLIGDAKEIGVAAFRLNEGEARTWRAFVAQLDGAALDDVLACWHKHGKRRDPMPVSAAVASFTAAKRAEGVSEPSLLHFRAVFDRFSAAFEGRDAGSISREEIDAWLSGLKIAGEPAAEYTRRTHAIRVRSLFRWLKVNRLLHENPCDGLKPPRITPEEVEILTVDQARTLFEKNADRRELCGRLALEAFAGLRFSSAAVVTSADIDGEAKGIVLPAATIKTRRRQFIDELPATLWAWVNWSDPKAWKFTPRDYMREKSLAFVRSNVPHPHNCLRHSFASYHSAQFKDATKTAAILCHTSPKMLYAHYKGRATRADGESYFAIVPPA